MTTTGWMDSWRRREAPTTSFGCILGLSEKRQEPQTTANYLLGTQGPRGAPHGGPCQHTHSGVPVSARTISDGSVGTTIGKAKEMWFLRLLLEWPGFPTLLYSVKLCTAAVSLRGECFCRIIVLGKQNVFMNVHSFFQNYSQVDGGVPLQKPYKTLVFWLTAKNAPTYC